MYLIFFVCTTTMCSSAAIGSRPRPSARRCSRHDCQGACKRLRSRRQGHERHRTGRGGFFRGQLGVTMRCAVSVFCFIDAVFSIGDYINWSIQQNQRQVYKIRSLLFPVFGLLHRQLTWLQLLRIASRAVCTLAPAFYHTEDYSARHLLYWHA